MRLITVDGIDTGSIPLVVGAAAYTRGLALCHQRAVVHMDWDARLLAVCARVRAGRGRTYETSVSFEPRRGDLFYVHGECDCQVGLDCQHCAAVAIAAAGQGEQAAPPWEDALQALVARPRESGDAATPLAVELSLDPQVGPDGQPRPRLTARLVRPGRAGWVGGTVTWGRIASPYGFGEYRQEHVRLLREWYAAHQSRSSGHSAYGYHRDERSIDLTDSTERIWSFLDEAAHVGVQIVHARKALGPVAAASRSELGFDVTAGPAAGSLCVRPVLTVEGIAAARPVVFLGSSGHGVVYAAEGDANPQPIRLGRMNRPVSPALRRMALAGGAIAVPAEHRERFATDFSPRLRHVAPVASSDAAFDPPAVSGPTLVLKADYGEGHELDLAWEWSYDVGERRFRAPLAAPPGDDLRDPLAEAALLDGLDLPLERFGLQTGGELHPSARLRDMDTMRFTTELVPLIAGMSRVVVEQEGEPAAYRDTGDTVRIGLSTDAVRGENDWFDLGVDITVEGRTVPFHEVFRALAAGEAHLLLPDGAWFSLDKPQLQALRTLIEEARALQDAPAGPLRISRFQAGLWDELAAIGVVQRQAAAWREQVGGLLGLSGLGDTPLPPGLRGELRSYQRDGFQWLAFLHRHGLGGVLADDMGLGKTLQTLALIAHARETEPAASPFLIVAPTSVVANWAAEARRFTPGLRVVAITDTLRRRGRGLAEDTAGADVVVTSYTLFRLDAESYAAADWAGLVLDEAQFVKNHQSKVHACARRLPAPFKLAITGTPMENNLMELWSLLSITAPGLFPSPTRFKEHFARPIEKDGDTELLARLRRRIKPLVKRRTKEQVAADLPAKQEQVLEVELDPRHRRLYQQHLQRERQKVLGLVDDVDRNRFTILRSLTLLRQLSLHPGLVDPQRRHLGGGKTDAIVEQLQAVITSGHRALVFSQFTRFLGHVRERLDAAGIPYAYLDGSTRRRAEAVEAFTGGTVPVFLISLKAGGFGLNLTEADYCFLLDPWWNPATEAQAVDRAHRIGQTRTVMVYRLIAKDTIEEKVHALARRKAELVTGVMDEGDVFGSTLDADDVRELLA